MLRYYLSLSVLLILSPMALFAAETSTIDRAGEGHGKRIALVVGNDSYQEISVLRNARSDARAVANALKAVGFEIDVRFDLKSSELKRAVRHFKSRVEGGDEAVFYFSGHGVQLGGANYLLPVDIVGENEDQIKDDALPLQRVLDDLQEQKARFSLAIIDACRNNPFKIQGKSLGGRGLVPINPASGQMVLYSAGSGQQALDRLNDKDRDPNGLFTRILLTEMNRPGVPVDRVLRNVRDQVVKLAKSVKHEQVPALYDQAIGEFYFRPGRRLAEVEPALPDSDVPQTEALKLDDLNQEAQRHKGWQDWQNRMRADYAQVENLSGGGEIKQQAWTRFLAAYPENNPYSNEAENLRASARTALESAKRRQPGQTFKDCADCPEMVVIPAGNFQMGSPESEKDRSSDEGPVHLVNVASFVLGKTEVTQAQWRAVMGSDPPELFFIGCDNCPVETVSWDDIQAFIVKLNAKTGQSYRLPSEAEWEYACRAGGQQRYCGGDELDRLAWYDKNSGSKTHAVATKQANAWGLHDMSGNVWEWTQDCWNERYTGAPSDGSAWTKGNCSYRVLRGGSWVNLPKDARAAYRNGDTPGGRSDNYGFRLARTF